MRKYIFVVGGVMSGVGKGVTTASIACILQARGFSVTAIKIDPYINVDAGTMNPTEHGEVFVLDDGDETDQDMGNYERFLDVSLSRDNYMTTGRVYQSVIERERNLEFEGRNVEVVPDIPLEVVSRIKRAASKNKADITIVEIGGTVGEYQNILFLEAARMMKTQHPDNVMFVLVSYLPTPPKVGEMKTKPTQYAARTLNGAGIQADIIVARAETPLDDKRRQKLSLLCSVSHEDVISAPDVESIYEVPLNFEEDKLSARILKKLKVKSRGSDMGEWTAMVKKVQSAEEPLRFAVVGKYFSSGSFILSDVYISVLEAIKHATYSLSMKPVIEWVSSEEFEKSPAKVKELGAFDAVIVPGGFGTRGVEGIVNVITFCRENKVPFLGICYGMQLAVVEYARTQLKLKYANTVEMEPDAEHPVVHVMEDQIEKLRNKKMGGSMRLGAYEAHLKKGTLARKLYSKEVVSERHRHRYEVNNAYVEQLEEAGLVFSATSPEGDLMEMLELKKEVHPYYIATQFHPEFTSRPLRPHPLFLGLAKAAKERREQ
ncbi:MAG: CTP synthase [bacterium]|nr:CTP synthase [bacterium]